MKYYVEIVKFEDERVVHSIECKIRSSAEKVERGVNISLNYDLFYYTRIVEEL